MPSIPIKLNQLTFGGSRSFSATAVPASQPSGSCCLPVTSLMTGLPSGSTLLERSGTAGGRSRVSGRTAMVRRHQAIIKTPITVVAAMIFRALSLDSRIPRTLALQKYRVIAAAIATEPHSSGS